MADSIKEYLIGLGFNLDLQGFKRFNEMLADTGKGFLVLGERSLAVASAVGIAVERVASNYEDLYYLSQRTGSAVQNLQATAYGFTQIGLQAGDAKSMVDSLAMALRTNPGNGALLQMLGVGGGDANSQAMSLVRNLSHLPFYVASQYAGMFGISPQQLLMMEQGLPDLERAEADHIKRLREAGLNTDRLGDRSHQFMTDLRKLEDEFGIVKDVIGADFIQPADWVIRQLEWLTEEFTAVDKASAHWLSTLGAIAASLGALAALRRSLGWIAGLFGAKTAETAAATAAGGAGAGGAAAAAGSAALTGGVAGGIIGLSAIKRDSETGDSFRTWLRQQLGIADPHEPAPWQPGGSWQDKSANDNGGDGRQHRRGWWTPERQQHAMRVLVAGGLTPLAASALVSRWKNVESPEGPGSSNNIGGGHWGIAQWDRARAGDLWGNDDFDAQLNHVVDELNSSEARAKRVLNSAQNSYDAARGGSAYERASGWNPYTNTDDFTGQTATGIGDIAPLGSHDTSGGGDVTLHQQTSITVNGSDNPKATSDYVLKGQAGVNADLVRNAGATVR